MVSFQTTRAEEERAVLLACLEWQVEAGCDCWLASDSDSDSAQAAGEKQEEGRGWGQAESLARNLLDSLSPQVTAESAMRSAGGVLPRSSATSARPAPTVSSAVSSAVSSVLPAAAQRARSPSMLLAPADAVVEARKVAEGCNTLEELERAVQGFDLCPLKKGARSTVFAEGNPDAELVVVGEAPGRDEDEQGKPFVGESGQLLSRMLKAIDITSREQYRITNLVYWRPPGNRPPNSDEVAVCYPFFLRHMALVKPRWLFLLGNVAMQNVLGERRGISKVRGQFFPLTLGTTPAALSVKALPSFHPSYLLRTPAKKAAAWHDLLVLRRAMHQG